jgi:hypothetical protein
VPFDGLSRYTLKCLILLKMFLSESALPLRQKKKKKKKGTNILAEKQIASY